MRLSAIRRANEPHQDVVVDPVEELLQVHVDHHSVPGRNIRLRSLHRLVRRVPGRKPKLDSENVGSQPLQHLHTAC